MHGQQNIKKKKYNMFVLSFRPEENKVTTSFMRQTDKNVYHKQKLLRIKWEIKILKLKTV